MQPVLGVEHSLSGRAWRARLDASGERTATALAQRHQLPELVARVLAGRGVCVENATHELAPTIRDLMPDPHSLTDGKRFVSLLADAVQANRRIAIFSDYDVDGATAAAVVARTLAAFGKTVPITIPDRVTEGYGPSVEAMHRLAAGGTELLILLDCGAGAHEPVAAARAAGMTVLVADHHPVDAVAPADAVINPNRADDLSGLGDCAAVAVAFVAMAGFLREMRLRGHGMPINLMTLTDCVALGTVADVVPLSAFNRALIRSGFKAIGMRTNRGLAALTQLAQIAGPIDSYHLGFVLGPRINAGGRIGEAGLGAALLTTDDDARATAIASILDRLNRERRTLEQAALSEADAMVTQDAVIFVAGPWHPGVAGLVAARLKERYRRPAIAVALGEGSGVGSGRSISGVDLGAAVREAAADGLIVKGGGHAMAAGLTVEPSRIEDIRRWFFARLEAEVERAIATASLSIDGVAALGALDEPFARALTDFGPWGAGREKPLIALDGVFLERAAPVGSGEHFRLTLRGVCGRRGEAMAFRPPASLVERLRHGCGGAVHLAVEVGHGTFRGAPRAELSVVDMADIPVQGRRAA